MSIKNWPEQDRPREKLLNNGAQSLNDAELLAIFLRIGCNGLSAVELARNLLGQYKDIRQLLNATPTEFFQHKGLGPAKYVQLQAALEIGRRYLQAQLKQMDVLEDTSATKLYLKARLRDLEQEVFAVLFLNNQNQVLNFEILFYGTINHTHIHPREVLKRALHHNAAAVILAHNHPSGMAEPSNADIQLTQQLQHSLTMIDVKLLDHFIVGDRKVVSFVERGLI